jgi:hypothetical protein
MLLAAEKPFVEEARVKVACLERSVGKYIKEELDIGANAANVCLF